jgi:hypothetical protein
MFDIKRVAEILSELYSEQLGYPVTITFEQKEKEK